MTSDPGRDRLLPAPGHAAAALVELRAGLAGLIGADLSPGERQSLITALAAAERLRDIVGGPDPQFPGTHPDIDPAAFDPAPLNRLFALIGPADAADLTTRLKADLETMRRGIVTAFGPPPDVATLRRHAHSLIAVAGTCGATGLHRAALALQAGSDATLHPELPLLIEACFDAILARINTGLGSQAT
ncbi:MAG: hypothetical protein KF887_08925 [Paracoccaceae bacterium]|nr:MAG: hypothetical protein KF887_08925 [Paracoccaceae bacterium]